MGIRYAVPSLIYAARSCSDRADFGSVGQLEHPYQHPMIPLLAFIALGVDLWQKAEPQAAAV